MRASAILFLTLYLLRALVAEADSALSGLHVWIFAGGLYVTYAALAFPFWEGLPAAVLAGLICDAASPVPFGTQGALFAAAFVALYKLRERLQRDETAVRVVVALVLNLGMFLVLAALGAGRSPSGVSVWPRVLSDLVWSQAALALAAPWFFALQEASLKLARAYPGRVV